MTNEWPKYVFLSLLLAFILTFGPATQAQTTPTATTGGLLGLLAVDKDGLPISDLKSTELRVRINKEDRNILSLSAAPERPKTIGLFFDISGSRRNDKHIEQEIQAATSFLQSIWCEGDEGFVLAFGDKLYFVARPTHDLHQVLELLPRVADAVYYGSTALYDALCGVQFKKGEGVEREKLYVVLSDFEDNVSKHSKTDAIKCLTEEKVRLFSLLLGSNFGSYGTKITNKRAQEAAHEIAERSGGEVLAPVSDKDLVEGFGRIASDLRGAYRVEYESPVQATKQQKLHVETTRPHARLLYAHD